MYINHIAEI